MRTPIAIVLLGGAISSSGLAQPAAEVRHIEIDTREGTWMSLDVSPDGRQIVFDLLGDIYMIPVAGGDATRLTQPLPQRADGIVRGQSLNVQPRFSPDGTSIVFVSDREGADNVYVMNVDGSDVRAITSGREMHTSPTFTPDGHHVAVRRAGGVFLYPLAGGAGERITQAATAPNVSGVAFSPDGASVYFSVPVDPVRNEIPHGRTFQIKRLDRGTGAVVNVTDNFGGAVRPLVTPDGTTLTYATFDDGEYVLRARELATNRERIVRRGIEFGAALGGANLDLLPGYAFSPDGRFVFLSYGGGIHRVAMTDGRSTAVPFLVRTTIHVGPRNAVEVTPLEGRMPVRMLNWAHFSPDRSRAVFEAIGKVWIADGNGGNARRLTTSSAREYAPSISPDGKWVAYVTWSDTARGHLYKVPITGGNPVRLTREAGYYANPNWSPDGAKVVVIVGDNSDLRGLDPTQDPRRHLAWISSSGGALNTILSTLTSGGRFGGFQDIGAQFNRDGTRVWFVSGNGAELRSAKLDGSDERVHLAIAHPQYQIPTYIAVSPDESRVLFTTNMAEVWMLPLPSPAEKPVVADARTRSVPGMIKLSAPAGYAPRWISNTEVSWVFGNRLFRRGTAPSDSARDVRIELTAEVPGGRGTIALTDARIITMKGDEVIERGVVIVRDNRIVDVGATGSVAIPAGATVMNLAGATIMPGLLDLHDHGFGGSAIRNWAERHVKAAVKLAYGVTVSRDLSAPLQASFAYTELINSGAMPGPRAYAAGAPIVPLIMEIRTLDEALATVQMMKDLGAVVIKSYQQPTRGQRQLLAEAARRTGIRSTAEGSLDYKNNLGLLLDGYTASEHLWGLFPLYGDVGQLMAKTGFFYTPTTGTSAAGSEYWFARMAVDTDPKQQHFVPHAAREALARRVKLAKIAPEWEPTFHHVVQSVNRLASHGAKIALGSHDTPTPGGLGAHWEMWSYVEGGMKPIDAIRAGTITGAEAIGMSAAIGSIERGKLADLLILDANPLDDIRNTIRIRNVMLNGILYNAHTLNPIRLKP